MGIRRNLYYLACCRYCHDVPITCLHFGPALLLKRVAGNQLNLKTFALAQVLLDMEPGLKLIGLLPEGAGLHTCHTWALGGYGDDLRCWFVAGVALECRNPLSLEIRA